MATELDLSSSLDQRVEITTSVTGRSGHGPPPEPEPDEEFAPSSSAPRALTADVEALGSERLRRVWLSYLVLVISVLCTALTTAYVNAAAKGRDTAQFRVDVDRTQAAIADRLDADVALLDGCAAFVAAHPSATAEDLRRVLNALEPRAHAAVIQDLGITREMPGDVVDVVRRAAMDQARDTGAPVATGRVSLKATTATTGESEAPPGFVIYAPIYQGGLPPETIEARRATLTGFVHGTFPAAATFRGILGEDASRASVDVEVYAAPDRSPAHLLHRSSEGRAVPADEPALATTSVLDIAGRPFTLSFVTRPGFDRGSGRELVPFIIGVGLLVSIVLFTSVRAEVVARAQAERRAAFVRTSERALREGEQQLRRLAEAEGEARRAAEEAARFRDEVLATLSHELRTPLTAVMGWVRMLRRGSLNAAAADRALAVIERNVQREAELVDDLLDASGIMSGNLRVHMRPIPIESVIAAAVQAARPASLARSIRLDVACTAVGQRVIGDPARLRQVIWNLLSNAIRFTPSGGWVHVSVSRVGAQVEIAVADNGRGIAPAFLPQIFERFRKAEGSVKYASSGLGLGLSLVRHLVELHGGVVRADSPGEGRGAIFTVTLPAAPDSAERSSRPSWGRGG